MSPKTFDLPGWQSGGSWVLGGGTAPPPPPPPPPPVINGTPYVTFSAWATDTTLKPYISMFTGGQSTVTHLNIVKRIDAARSLGVKIILMMTGGSHSRYINTTTAQPWKFDLEYWKHGNPETTVVNGQTVLKYPDGTGMDRYNTAAIKKAIADGVRDGIILWCDMQDEPQAQNWSIPSGPSGITRQTIDAMAAYVKGIFPTLPCYISCRTDYSAGTGDASYAYINLDGYTTQYIQSFGSVTAWRDLRLVQAQVLGIRVAFSMNVLSGGAGFHMTSCPIYPDQPRGTATGGFSPVAPAGSSDARCSMGGGPSGQLEVFGAALMGTCATAGPAFGSKAVALVHWDYDAGYYSADDNVSAFKTLALAMATRANPPVTRP